MFNGKMVGTFGTDSELEDSLDSLFGHVNHQQNSTREGKLIFKEHMVGFLLFILHFFLELTVLQNTDLRTKRTENVTQGWAVSRASALTLLPAPIQCEAGG